MCFYIQTIISVCLHTMFRSPGRTKEAALNRINRPNRTFICEARFLIPARLRQKEKSLSCSKSNSSLPLSQCVCEGEPHNNRSQRTGSQRANRMAGGRKNTGGGPSGAGADGVGSWMLLHPPHCDVTSDSWLCIPYLCLGFFSSLGM